MKDDMPVELASLTVVVPVGPGDALSPSLRAWLVSLPAGVQVVEVRADGPATDRDKVQALASQSGCGPSWQVIAAPRGRASQQNAGARAAGGDWLWFLHADCMPAPGALEALARFIRDGSAPGYFELRFLDDGPRWMRLNAMGVWLRSHCLGLPFGDQGLLLPRGLFERMGGFDPQLACGEDHALVWRLRRAGIRIQPVGAQLFTSARKYAERGWWAATCWSLRETWRQARRFSRTGAAR